MLSNECSKDLIRQCDEYVPKQVAIIGNGAIDGGSDILKDCIKKHHPIIALLNSEGIPHGNFINLLDNTSIKGYDAQLAALVAFTDRFFRYALLRLHNKNDSDSKKIADVTKKFLKASENFRKELGKSYITAQKQGKINIRAIPTCMQPFMGKNCMGVITTNWDELIWADTCRFVKVIQLHGMSSDYKHLILPTEFSIDNYTNYILNFFCDTLTKKAVELGQKEDDLFISYKNIVKDSFPVDRNGTGEIVNKSVRDDAYLKATTWLQKAEELYLWGIAFNEYDAELNMLVAYLDTSKYKKIYIINRDDNTMERIIALLRLNSSRVEKIVVK
jgi:hypothetical protein